MAVRKRGGAGKAPDGKKSAGKRAGKAPGRGRGRLDWRLHLMLLAAALLIVGLVWLARREVRPQPPAETAPAGRTVSVPLPETRPAVDGAAAAREQVEAFLAVAEVAEEKITREPAERPRLYRIAAPRPQPAAIARLRQRLGGLVPPLALADAGKGGLEIKAADGTLLLSLFFAAGDAAPARRGGRVAIIIDDLGRGAGQVRQLLKIGQPLTFAILPGEPHSSEVAGLAHAAGREVLLHLPMEPQGYPKINPGPDALLVAQSDAELRERLAGLLSRVPQATGINNHMGSRFTEDERGMATVMALLGERRLFFVDSVTTSGSIGRSAAAKAGVPYLRRDVFLDNVAEVPAITRQLRQLAAQAARHGSAVGIGHPHPQTLQALKNEIPRLAAGGVTFVTISELLKNGG